MLQVTLLASACGGHRFQLSVRSHDQPSLVLWRVQPLKILWSIAALLFSGLASEANAASFDCTKASTAIEKTICADPSLSAKDSALGRLYNVVRQTDPAARDTQRKWVQAQQQVCTTRACLASAYDERLRELFSETDKGADVFVTADGAGTLKTVTVEGSWIVFSIDSQWVGAGEGNINFGEALGAVAVSGPRFSFTEDDCKLSFVRTSTTAWQVTESDECSWGLNVSMDGTYRLKR